MLIDVNKTFCGDHSQYTRISNTIHQLHLNKKKKVSKYAHTEAKTIVYCLKLSN